MGGDRVQQRGCQEGLKGVIGHAGLPRGVEDAVCGIYSEVVAASKPMRSAMLAALLKRFESGSCLHSDGAATANLR